MRLCVFLSGPDTWVGKNARIFHALFLKKREFSGSLNFYRHFARILIQFLYVQFEKKKKKLPRYLIEYKSYKIYNLNILRILPTTSKPTCIICNL